jgi:chorismate dehydratase
VRVTSTEALNCVRVGCVRYLNSVPLICGYDGPVVFDHPSALAAQLADGLLDVALVPTFKVLFRPRYALVDGVGIVGDGDVFSVFLACKIPLGDVHRIALDPASLTSANLVRVILAEYYGIIPEFVAPGSNEADAELLIGDQAIDYRVTQPKGVELLDLGGEWKRRTGLPFVYAVWAIRPEVQDPKPIADAFRALREYGEKHLDEVIANDSHYTREIRDVYLRKYVRFDIGEAEREGIFRYRALLEKHHRITDAATPLKFV